MIWPMLLVGALGGAAGFVHLRRRADAGFPALVAGALLVHLAAALALPITSNDLWSNVAYGRLAVLGHNVYVHGVSLLPGGEPVRALVDPRWQDLPMPYGPIVWAACALAGLSAAPWAAMAIFKSIMLAAALASVLLAARLCRTHFSGDDGRAGFALFALCPLFAWELSGQGHNDALLVLSLTGFVLAAAADHEVAALACLAAGIAAKFVAAPVAGLYLVAIARKSLPRALAYGAALAAVSVGMMLPFWHGPSTLTGLWTNTGPQIGHTARSIGDRESG